MFDDAAEIMNKSLAYPLIFIVGCLATYFFVLAILYYRFLYPMISEAIAKIVLFIGAFAILFQCVKRYDWIKSFVDNWTSKGMIIGFITFIVLFVILGVIGGLKNPVKSNPIRKNKSNKTAAITRRSSTDCRSDEIILSSPLNELSGAEFEHLLALYFKDIGFEVKEVGVGGKDGGVDLVIVDKLGEKTAVQAKCYAVHNNVGVQVVRELVGAKRNHDCILSLLITTSYLTEPAQREAEQFKVDYWHGLLIEQKLKVWGKWQPSKGASSNRIAVSQGSAKDAVNKMKCSCGSEMLLRKSKEGKKFWGCSQFPACRKTKSV
jgi:restriction system protein